MPSELASSRKHLTFSQLLQMLSPSTQGRLGQALQGWVLILAFQMAGRLLFRLPRQKRRNGRPKMRSETGQDMSQACMP